MNENKHELMKKDGNTGSIRKNLISGFFVVLPLSVTYFVVTFIMDILISIGKPFVSSLYRGPIDQQGIVAYLFMQNWFQSFLALMTVIAGLYIIGAIANQVIGKRLIALIDRIIESVPLVKTVYSATRTLISSLGNQDTKKDGRRVVLIEFPSPDMRTLGFVTNTFIAQDTGKEIASVYVPTTPNPTSGYVELVEVERLVFLDWDADAAMAFIVSGGSMMPSAIRMNPDNAKKDPA